MMNVKDFECRSFEQANELLGSRDSRKVCNNTVLWRTNPFYICLELHGYTIAKFSHTGGVALNHRGWLTTTTKNRMNKVMPGPWRICQRGDWWYVRDRDTAREFKFVDGMIIYPNGLEQIRTAAILRGVVEQS